MKKLLIIFLTLLFTSCEYSNISDSSQLAQIKNVVIKTDGKTSAILSVKADYVNFSTDTICCKQCDISIEDADSIKNGKEIYRYCTYNLKTVIDGYDLLAYTLVISLSSILLLSLIIFILSIIFKK